jgi:hypothetical protein
MATDPPAVRMARSGAHRAGNHRLCLVGRSPDAPTVAVEGAHDLEEVTEEFLTSNASLAQLRGTILLSAARAADRNPTPGMMRALAEAVQAYRYVSTSGT